ncbi:SAM-dependent methyltransferase [Micromonospora zhanjiangensis]|uniref:SAM-dependent methyltransferase n=1 Tax=Micromonospora zhanjiangensis TaxID=1522057 RepID=A0ABV8KKS9_9ACTN
MTQPVDLQTDRPHPARVYQYWLGGKDNYAADRELGDKMAQLLPSLPGAARANRGFMLRSSRYLAGELGIRQFLDLGTGLPLAPNLHEVVQQIEPGSRVVYVDNDPIVLIHARALLTSHPDGATAYLDSDIRNPEMVLTAARDSLDLDQPVAVSLIAITQLIPDDAQVRAILDALMGPLCPGSTLSLSAITADSDPDQVGAAVRAAHAQGIPVTPRTRAQTAAMFTGLDLVDPGVVLAHRWHPDQDTPNLDDHDVHVYTGVAIKPAG